MSKMLLVLATLGLATPSFAAPAPTSKQPNAGEKYVVGHEAQKTALTQAQVEEVMKTKLADVDACWRRVPADQRKKDASAVLKIEIDDGGEVQTVDVAGVPGDAARCIAKAAVAWTFPETDFHADAASFAYPVTLRAN
jgi:hypothetical protein